MVWRRSFELPGISPVIWCSCLPKRWSSRFTWLRGFPLYLNRRSELEAWDIELAFRRLAARQSATPLASSLLVLLVLAVWLPLLKPVQAEEAPQPPSVARQAIDAVLTDPVFGQDREDWSWRWRQSDSPVNEPGGDWIKVLFKAIEWFSEMLRGLLWVFAGLGLAAAIFLVLRYRQAGSRARVAPAAPEFLFQSRPASGVPAGRCGGGSACGAGPG